MKIKVADYIVELLRINGASNIFLVPGGGNMHLTDAVKRNKKIKYLSFFHEQSASIAAESYSRSKSKLGVALVTSGPGSTNAITGVAGAWIESVPLVVISGQVKTQDIKNNPKIRQNGPQEVDITSLVKKITKYSITIKKTKDIVKIIKKGITQAISLRKGPVWIDLPLDIQGSIINIKKKDLKKIQKRKKKYFFPKKRILDLLKKSKKPIILAGHGVRLSEASREFRSLIKKTGIPFMTTWNCIDLVEFKHNKNLGSPGVVARRNSNISIQLSDLIICIGTSLNKVITAFNEKNFGFNAKKIIVDIDKDQLNKVKIPNSLKIQADAKNFINYLISNVKKTNRYNRWSKDCLNLKLKFEDEMLVRKKNKKIINHYECVEAISKALKEGDNVSTGSSGLAIEIFYTFFKSKRNQRVFLTSGLGSMGYGIPSAIGNCVANKKKTILIESDGSLMFNIQELSTIKSYNLPIKIIVLNNFGYASIRNTHSNYFSKRFVGTGKEDNIFYPSFKLISKANKLKYFCITSKKQLKTKLPSLIKGKNPTLIEILLNKNEELLPKVGSYIDKNNKIKSRPLQLMTPLISIKKLDKILEKKEIRNLYNKL